MSAAPDVSRMARVRTRMDELGVDVLLLSLGADLPWLTGYRAMPLERLTLLLLPRRDEAVMLVPALEAARVPDASGRFVLRPWSEDEDAFDVAADLVRATAGTAASLAVSDRAWAGAVLALQARLPDARWRAGSEVTAPLRAVKDASEIAALRAAAVAADVVAEAVQAGELVVAGRTERQVSEAIGARLLAEGHDRVNFAIVGSGPNGASPHHEPGSRRIERGDVVVCDFGGELRVGDGVGYCSDITRTVVVGAPDAEVRDCYEVLAAAHHAGVAAARVGVAAEDVDAAARSVIVAAGLGERFIHRTGHGIGIEEHEDPYLVAGNSTPLEVGHAFSVEPGIYLPGRFGMRLEDIVVVGPDGPEALNRADRSLVAVEA
jgi:Xaa-Pro aminopeptidase